MTKGVRITHLLFLALFVASSVYASGERAFKTKCATVHYSEDKDLGDFIWRLGGQRVEFPGDTALATSRIDRIVQRVEAILDMWPPSLDIQLYLHREPLSANKVAYFETSTRAIHIAVDSVTDGVLAHEVAHAVIRSYFTTPPSSKAQEILTQYVDRNLWSDY